MGKRMNLAFADDGIHQQSAGKIYRCRMKIHRQKTIKFKCYINSHSYMYLYIVEIWPSVPGTVHLNNDSP